MLTALYRYFFPRRQYVGIPHAERLAVHVGNARARSALR